MIKRYLEDIILAHLFKKKAIILYGARQVGKTTLVEALVKKLDKRPSSLTVMMLTYVNCLQMPVHRD